MDRVPDQTPSAYVAFQEGMQLLESDSVHAAVVALERARDLEPAQGSIREALGRALFRTGRYGAAREEFEQVVELDPVNDYAHFGLGLTLGRLGDRTGARRHLKLAVAMHPRDEYVRALADLGEPPGAAGGA